MEEINYEEARIEGGIESFRDVTEPDNAAWEVGELAVPLRNKEELPLGIVDEDEEPLIAY
jgi:hypothetical protein